MRNKNAGKHPSYKKRGMSKDAIRHKQEYDKEFSATTEQKKKRSECNAKRKEAKAMGKNIKDLDYDHATNSFIKVSKNRGRKEKSRLKKG